MEAKGESPVLPMATGGAEGGLWPSVGCQGYLPVALCQVQCGDKLGSPQPFDDIIHLWQGVAVKLRDGFQFPEVISESQTSVGLEYYNDQTGLGIGGFFYNPFLDHPCQFLLNCLVACLQEPVVP